MAWDCPVSCLCKGPVVKCCEPQQVLFLPVKGHPNVTELLLDSCRLFVLNSDTLQNFSSLEKLSVKRTNLSSLDTDAFHYLPSLRSLILEDVNLSNTAIHHNTFAGLQITSLSLRNNHLDRIERHTFAGLVNVEHLDLSMNKIVSIEEKSFTTLKSLQVLNLENNSLSTITPLWFSGVSLNGTGMQISLRGNNLICECKYRGIDLPEYAWFKRSVILPNKTCMVHTVMEECQPPHLQNPYQVVHGKVSQTLNLHCTVTGFPFPKVSWILYNGFQLSNNGFPPFYDKNGTLNIKLVHSSFGGLYACVATNLEGTAIGLYNLVIQYTAISMPPLNSNPTIILPTNPTITISRNLWAMLWISLAILIVISIFALFGFCRCLFRYIQQHMHSDFTFNQFVDTPNILTLPENPQPISDSEERPSQVMHWSRDNSEDTPPQLSRQSNGSSQQLQHRAQEPAQI